MFILQSMLLFSKEGIRFKRKHIFTDVYMYVLVQARIWMSNILKVLGKFRNTD